MTPLLAGQPPRLAVIGLGYVGLPLAVAFSAHHDVVGFDISEPRVAELRAGHDGTREVRAAELREAARLRLTTDPAELAACNVFIVTVPTPIDDHKRPDLRQLLAASSTAGDALSPGDIVIYESTVYPGATEGDCAPVLEARSGLTLNEDFYLGYSPERANPGDREHRLSTIVKVTAGSTPQAADFVDDLYSAIVPAGTHKASSIQVAEAAKVIENTQRDLNIALVNEFALIFARMGLDTHEVLAAAGTKWNFLKFTPGLVGGHCIGVDPYYLTHQAEAHGYRPEVILSGRRVNDGMGAYIAGQVAKAMIKRRIHLAGSRVLVLGLAFKENCPDIRNTRVIDIVRELGDFGAEVEVFDPWIDCAGAEREYGLRVLGAEPAGGGYDAVILAVAHRQFREMGAGRIRAMAGEPSVFCDVKGVFAREESDLRL
jgi:UDP-N-acetyl-D-galactosamine dehydrogenase